MILERLGKNFLAVIILVIVGGIIYANSLHAPFQFDDHDFLFDNPLIKDIKLLMHNWDSIYVKKRKVLTYLTFALNYHWGGTNTFGYHLVNTLLHITNAALLYYVLLYLLTAPALSKTDFSTQRQRFALFGSLIFLVHPIQTQAVTYIWERAEVFSGFFYLLAYLCYLKGRVQGRKIFFGLAAAVFYVGMFAKGTIVTLPLMIMLTELCLWPPHRRIKNIMIGVFIFSILSLIVLRSWEKLPHVLEKIHLDLLMRIIHPIWDKEYVLTQLPVAMQYIKLCFLPINQNLDYYSSLSKSWLEWPTLLSLVALVVIFSFAVYFWRRRPLVSFGIFWFFIYLLPTSLGAPSLEVIMEHRLYLSVAGFAMFFLTMLFSLAANHRFQNTLLVIIFIGLSYLTIARNHVWRSEVTLMEDTIKKSPLNPRPYSVLGTYYLRNGQIKEAYELLQKAVQISPGYSDAHNNLGVIYLKLGQLDQAQKEFEIVMSSHQSARHHAYVNLGQIYLLKGERDKARKVLEKGLAIRDSDSLKVMLGALYLQEGNFKEARAHFERALQINPYNEKAYYGLGEIHAIEGDHTKALAMFQEALKLKPDFIEAHVRMGNIYFAMRDLNNAARYLEKAFQLNPTDQTLFKRLVDIYEMQKKSLGDSPSQQNKTE